MHASSIMDFLTGVLLLASTRIVLAIGGGGRIPTHTTPRTTTRRLTTGGSEGQVSKFNFMFFQLGSSHASVFFWVFVVLKIPFYSIQFNSNLSVKILKHLKIPSSLIPALKSHWRRKG